MDEIICTGDLVSFMVESTGYLGIPSISEPVPERADATTHLRAIPAKSGTKELPGDYSTRCMFRILSDQGQTKSEKIKYGTVVRLMHEPSGLFAVATDNEDKHDKGSSPFFSVHLKKSLTGFEVFAAQWVISSRYRLRGEGDYVNINDFVVLRSAHFKQRLLTTVRTTNSPKKFDSLVGLNADAFNKKGLQIFRVTETNSSITTAVSEEEHPVVGGDYIKLMHQELRGYMICRGDNEADLNGIVSPMGRFSFDQLVDPEYKNAPFIRAGRGQYDQDSCLNVWQILPQNVQSLGKFKSGSSVRLRHVLTGLYLCMRETTDLDCPAVHLDSKFDPTGRVGRPGAANYSRMVVATCLTIDPSTLFLIHTSGDITMNGLLAEINASANIIDLNDAVFFIHKATQLMLVSGTSQLHPYGSPRFGDYSSDQPIRPKEFVGDFAILSETFRIQIASKELVEDTLFAAKFLPLTKAATACLQLTPRMDNLYLPLYRHFNLALHTLVRWALGRFDSNGQLVRHPRGVTLSTVKADFKIEDDTDSDASDHNESDEEVSHVAEEDVVGLNSTSMADFELSPDLLNSSPRRRSSAYSRVNEDDDIAAALAVLNGPLSDSDAAAAGASKPPRILPISSLSPWIGRGQCEFTKASIPAAILSERIDDVLAQVNVNTSRQNILRDMGLLEMLQNYINVVFTLLKVQTRQINQQHQAKVARRGEKPPMSQEEKEAIYAVPQIAYGCCVLAYDVINLCLIENPRTAMRLLGVKGLLLSMMSHEFLGWKPPIEQLLLSEQLARKNNMFEAGGFSRVRLDQILSPADVADIVEQMYIFHSSRNNADIHLLKLLVTMSCPGKRPNRYIQDQILEDIFVKAKVLLRPRIQDEEKKMSESGAEIHHSLLFSTRRMPGTDDWEVLFNGDFHIEKEKFDHGSLREKIQAETDSLLTLFTNCCSNEDGVLGLRDCEVLVEKLGFAGADLVIQSRSLNKCNFEKFTDWWWRNRGFYFPSLTSALNNLTSADVKAILGGKTATTIPSADPIPEYDYDVFTGNPVVEERPFMDSNPMMKKSDDERGSFMKMPEMVTGLSKNIANRRKSVGEFISKSLDWAPKQTSDTFEGMDLPDVPNLNVPTLSAMSPPSKVVSKPSEGKDEFETFDKIRQKIVTRIPGFDTLADNSKMAAPATITAKSPTFRNLFGGNDANASTADTSFDPVIVGSTEFEDEEVKQSQREEMERYSGLFITLSKPFARASQEMRAKKKTNSENWQMLTEVLAEEGDGRIWFRESCNLLSELCRGKNSYSQDFVSELLPADLIIGVLLRTGIQGSMSDKIIGCSLLTSVYLRHDFVFAATATAASEDCPVAVRAVEAAIETSAGKLFSQMNRRTFKSITESQGAILRRMLWSYLRDEIKLMDFTFTTKEVSEFNVALLKLANELLTLGYFDEADKFLENKKFAQGLLKKNDVNVRSSKRLFGFGRSREEEETAFDTIALENILIDKVIGTLKELRTNFKAMQNYVVNEIQFSAARGILSPEESTLAAKKISLKKGPNLGMNAAKYVGLYLDGQYTESFRIQATQEVIAILWSIFESRQLRRIRNIVGILRTPSLVFDQSILDDSDDTTQDLHNLDFSKKVRQMVSEQFIEPREFSLTYFRALLAATLFQNNTLRGNTYALIYRSLSPQIDVVNIIKNMRIVPNVEEAAAARFLSVFYSTLEKFWKRLLENPNKPSKYAIGTLKFCFDTMTSVCFRQFKEVEQTTNHRRNRRKFGKTESTMASPIAGSSASTKSIRSGGVFPPRNEKDNSFSNARSLSYNRLSTDRPTGSIEMKSFKQHERDLDTILHLTKRAKIATPHPALPWIHHIVKPTVVKLTGILRKILQTHSIANDKLDTTLPWDALNLAEQFYINRFFSFLATISFDSPVMCLEFFSDLSPILKKFWWIPECIGAANLMTILCQYTDLDELLDKNNINQIFSCILDLEEYESPHKQAACRTVVAILSNPTKGNFVNLVTKRVRSDIVENGSIRTYVHFNGKHASDYELDLHMLVLKIIVATLRIRTDHQFVDSVKALLTSEFCKEMLDANIPLQNRASFLEITALIYDHEEVPVDDYICEDMLSFCEMDMILAPETHSVLLDELEYPIIEYFMNGIVTILLRRCMNVNGIKVIDTKDVISRTTVFVAKEMRNPTKMDLFLIAKMNNFGLREVSDLGEPLNPGDLRVGALNQSNFFDTIMLLYNHLMAFDNRLLLASMQNRRYSDRLLTLMAAIQLIYRRMFPTEESVVPEEVACWKLVNEILPMTIMLKSKAEHKHYVANFLRTEGSDAYMSGIRQMLLPPAMDEKMYLSNKDSFVSYNDFTPVIPFDTLRKSAFYEVLLSIVNSSLSFISHGGLRIGKNANNTSTKQMKRMSDFDIWLQGGGRYIRAMGSFLGEQAPTAVSSYTLIHIMCCLLYNDIDKIREQKVNLKKMMERVQAETARLRGVQNALSAFGISEMVVRLVKKCENAHVHDPVMSELVPLSLKLGVALLASGNPEVQNDMMDLDLTVGYVASIRHMLRKCSMKLNKFLKKKFDGPYPVYVFRTISKVFHFCGMLCGGHNARGREFMRTQGGRTTLNINLVSDITSTLNVVLQVVVDHMKYINNDGFYEVLGPFVWRPMGDQKRRLIAWHQADEMNFLLMSQVSLCLLEGFNALKFICQDQDLENQLSATAVLTLCPALLEFTGSMQLRTSRDGIKWDCSDPYQFYKTYKAESKRANIFSDDKQAPYIRRSKKQWAELYSLRNKFSKNKITTIDMLGIDLDLFKELFSDVEQACLRMMNAMLDGDSETVVDAFSESLDVTILLQNMDNLFRLSLNASPDKQKLLKDNISFYLSLLSTLSSFVDKSSAILDKYIDQWKLDCIANGSGINKHFAAVEITSPSGILQKVFFPIPDFVLQYWAYPRVQQAKEAALWSVSRESPEDKLADFYLKMQGIITVMRRQQWLARICPPFRWMRYLLSDKSYFSYLPLIGMREFMLVLTLVLNIYYAYINFRETYPWYRNNEVDWAKDFFIWEDRGFFFWIVGIIHASFCGLLAFNDFINSPDADELLPIDLPQRDKFAAIDTVACILESSRNGFVMLLSAWWPICLCGFSVLALLRNEFWYALILLDVVPQIALMKFLVEAITRNAKKILYTLLLAAVFLYLFAVANVLFMPNQYGFDGRHTCTDVISCFRLHLDFGLTNPPEWLGVDNISPYTGREAMSTTYGYILTLIMGSVYNWVFVILINLVLQAIISGLIIDTFGEMRAENEEIDKDIRAGCFICSIDKDEFEQAGVSFTEHINDEHNMWKYIWFQIYLELKDPLSFSAPEYSAYKQLGNKQDFVHLGPVKKSLSIERRAGKVKEQFTPKVLFQGIQRAQEQQQLMMEELVHLRQQEIDNTKTLKAHGKALELIRKGVDNTAASAGDTDIYMRDLQEQLSKVTADIQRSVETSLLSMHSAVTAANDAKLLAAGADKKK